MNTLLLAAALLALPQDEEAKARALLQVVFTPYVFDGDTFPARAVDKPALLGEHRLETVFHDRAGSKVDAPSKPGAYRAIVRLLPAAGPPLQRHVTLFRTHGPLTAPTADPVADVARLAGLSVEAAGRQRALIEAILKPGGSLTDAARDPRFARLLAGLQPGSGPVLKAEDAYAVDRQAWVDLKRAGAPAPRFHGPVTLDGPPAPVVREGTPAEAGVKADAADTIDTACRAWAADSDQAFAVCVVRHGVIVLHRAYGERDGKPMTVETKSWMASVTKTMSAVLMMMAVDQGLAGLDDEVVKHAPAFQGIQVPVPLRLRHLFTHTHGFAKIPVSDEMADAEARLADAYPRIAVGKEWAYSGSGNILGGKILESLSGLALPQLYRSHLLVPLGMEQTDVVGSHADAQSVPLDMARYGQMLLNKGAYGRLRFMRENSFAAMLPRPLEAELGPGAKKTFGFGLDGKPEKFGHGAASAATFSVDVPRDLVVIVTRNKIGTNYDKGNGLFWKAVEASLLK